MSTATSRRQAAPAEPRGRITVIPSRRSVTVIPSPAFRHALTRNAVQLKLSRLSVSSPSRQAASMITEYLRVYTPHNYREKQNYRDHGASRDNRRAPVGTPPPREPCIIL